MPVVFQKILNDGSLIALWHINEDETTLLKACSESEREYVRQFSHPDRRKEWLAWHALLHQLAPGLTVTYTDHRKPVLKPNLSFPFRFIGVSHTSEYAAITLSPVECALDIEPISRDFSGLIKRFTSEEEQQLTRMVTPPELFPALIWCAKEALYKWYGQRGVDFLKDIRIHTCDNTTALIGRIADKIVGLQYFLWNGLCVVYTTGEVP